MCAGWWKGRAYRSEVGYSSSHAQLSSTQAPTPSCVFLPATTVCGYRASPTEFRDTPDRDSAGYDPVSPAASLSLLCCPLWALTAPIPQEDPYSKRLPHPDP